eukprot:COSAG01_NODE_57797_length_310_cov_0.616114_1_plen_49_part_00
MSAIHAYELVDQFLVAQEERPAAVCVWLPASRVTIMALIYVAMYCAYE